MTKVVYITGCLGFMASYVTRACLKRGWHVRGIDKCTYAANQNLLEEFNRYSNFVFEKKDINDIEFLYDCDYIISMAAESHVGNSIVNSKDFIKTNVDGIYNILDLMRNFRQEGKHNPILYHVSTDEVYADIQEGYHTELDRLKPSNPYSASKCCSDMLIQAWGRTYNIPYVIIRPTNNYGIGQYPEKLIPKTCKYLQLGRKIPLHNNGTPIRNWLHAEDTCSAILTLIDSGIQNEIFNVCGGFEQSNMDTVTSVIREYFQDDTMNVIPYLDLSYSRPGQDVRYAVDDSKIRSLGWSPKKVFADEIGKIVDFYKTRFIW